MSYERPEDKWKREKQYQAPTPGQPKPPANSPADEAYWMQEKQGRLATQPNQPQNPQEAQWMREKQGGPRQPPSANGQETQWMQEKRGGAPPPPAPQEQQWMREKQGNFGVPPTQAQQPGQDQWMREKQGLPPQTTQPGPQQINLTPAQNELAWHQEKNFKPAGTSSNRKLFIILGIVAVLIVAA